MIHVNIYPFKGIFKRPGSCLAILTNCSSSISRSMVRCSLIGLDNVEEGDDGVGFSPKSNLSLLWLESTSVFLAGSTAFLSDFCLFGALSSDLFSESVSLLTLFKALLSEEVGW